MARDSILGHIGRVLQTYNLMNDEAPKGNREGNSGLIYQSTDLQSHESDEGKWEGNTGLIYQLHISRYLSLFIACYLKGAKKKFED